MHEIGIARLAGSIEERKYVVGKLNALQNQVEAGDLDLSDFYREVIAMKHSIENKVM